MNPAPNTRPGHPARPPGQATRPGHPDNNGATASGWFDVAGFEIGDECGFVYGPVQGPAGQFFNQVINGHDYLTQEFSNASFFASGGGCLQHP